MPSKSRVFIVFGHDRANALALQHILNTDFGLDTIMLDHIPDHGRTIIRKFEEVAKRVDYAFALMTPDDFVKKKHEDYNQARPNVLFELGWFCGTLGLHRVCLLLKKGTSIPSDLDGIECHEFEESVVEVYNSITRAVHVAQLVQ